jgi:two-component system response regulator PilR (NtrC family)
VIRLEVPPLRERPEDLPVLVDALLRRFATEQGKVVSSITKEAFRFLSQYDFPGNVRELENIIERGVALSSGRQFGVGELPDGVLGAPVSSRMGSFDLLPEGGCKLDEVIALVERRLILQAMDRSAGVKKKACGLLGVTFRSLRYRMDKLNIEVAECGEKEEEIDEAEEGRVSSPEV